MINFLGNIWLAIGLLVLLFSGAALGAWLLNTAYNQFLKLIRINWALVEWLCYRKEFKAWVRKRKAEGSE